MKLSERYRVQGYVADVTDDETERIIAALETFEALGECEELGLTAVAWTDRDTGERLYEVGLSWRLDDPPLEKGATIPEALAAWKEARAHEGVQEG